MQLIISKQHFVDRNVTIKTKTHVYRATVKSTITYAAETGCLKVQLHMQQKQGV